MLHSGSSHSAHIRAHSRSVFIKSIGGCLPERYRPLSLTVILTDTSEWIHVSHPDARIASSPHLTVNTGMAHVCPSWRREQLKRNVTIVWM